MTSGGLSTGTCRTPRTEGSKWLGPQRCWSLSTRAALKGHVPNMRYSGPQLLSSWLHVASAVGNQAASSLAGLGPLGPLS
jgi:hypothetical protein